MKRTVALALTLFLVSVVALCPAIACPLTAHSDSGSCCHKPQSHHDPCPAKSVPDCPYTILEKSTTNKGAPHAMWIAALVNTGQLVALPVAGVTVHVPSRISDASCLYLRNRVLLI
ncbi:MAG: hypothetical protein ACLP59_03850 [Bryobacteraceae bacterium]